MIALVITIIVLLILAGVTIITLTGENGLIKKSHLATEKAKKAQIEEQLNLAILSAKTEKLGQSILIEDILQELTSQGVDYQETSDAIEGNYSKVILIEGKYKYGFNEGSNGEITFKEIGKLENDDNENIDIISPEELTPTTTVNSIELKEANTNIKQQYKYAEATISNRGGGIWVDSINYNNKTYIKEDMDSVNDEIKDIIIYSDIIGNNPNGTTYGKIGYYRFVASSSSIYINTSLTSSNAWEYLGESYLSYSINISCNIDDNENKIVKYYFSKDNGQTWESNEEQNLKNYTFEGLTEGTYTIKIRAEDSKGKYVDSNPVSLTIPVSNP